MREHVTTDVLPLPRSPNKGCWEQGLHCAVGCLGGHFSFLQGLGRWMGQGAKGKEELRDGQRLGGPLPVNPPFSDGNTWKSARQRPGGEEKVKKGKRREDVPTRDPKHYEVQKQVFRLALHHY